MKKNYILILCFSLCISGLNATVIKVDNNYPSIGDFTAIQAAHDAAANGDTILLTPSHIVYGGVTITKTIHLLGAGFATENSAILRAVVEGAILLNNGAYHSIIEGIDLRNHRITVDANDITIKRCKTQGIDVLTDHAGTIITGNEISCYDQSINAIIVEANNIVLIYNNLITSNSNGFNGYYTIRAYENVNISIYNNLISNYFTWNGIETLSININSNTNGFYNNIIFSGQTSGLYDPGYNICSGNQLPASNGNMINVDLNTVFVDYANGNYHLKPGSPAIGAGYDGLDIGVYGGVTPFVDGGYPSIPVIYSLEVPTTGSQQDGVKVTIKARSNQ